MRAEHQQHRETTSTLENGLRASIEVDGTVDAGAQHIACSPRVLCTDVPIRQRTESPLEMMLRTASGQKVASRRHHDNRVQQHWVWIHTTTDGCSDISAGDLIGCGSIGRDKSSSADHLDRRLHCE